MKDYKLAINHTIEKTNCPAKQHPLIPEQGPSHVSFNAGEDITSVLHFIFSRVYNKVFRSVLPLKPKPFQSNLIISGVLCVWHGIEIWKALGLLFPYVLIFYTIHHLEPSSLWLSALSMLNELCHQRNYFPDHYNFKTKWLTLLTEIKVEIWHTLLQFHLTDYYRAEQI
ncbi:hypothetical protein pdam_00006286 [Pocillopora damicornis]|uniref:Uncharacterized protein n=1 Tax=Pocillopora damicornis TaxID=46731 RepID=A0A3M6UQP0_POCDA|nr:hypothetical protein pdam_00006286 [Pocillopora damicornis]